MNKKQTRLFQIIAFVLAALMVAGLATTILMAIL